MRLTKHHGLGNDFLVLLDMEGTRPVTGATARAPSVIAIAASGPTAFSVSRPGPRSVTVARTSRCNCSTPTVVGRR